MGGNQISENFLVGELDFSEFRFLWAGKLWWESGNPDFSEGGGTQLPRPPSYFPRLFHNSQKINDASRTVSHQGATSTSRCDSRHKSNRDDTDLRRTPVVADYRGTGLVLLSCCSHQMLVFHKVLATVQTVVMVLHVLKFAIEEGIARFRFEQRVAKTRRARAAVAVEVRAGEFVEHVFVVSECFFHQIVVRGVDKFTRLKSSVAVSRFLFYGRGERQRRTRLPGPPPAFKILKKQLPCFEKVLG